MSRNDAQTSEDKNPAINNRYQQQVDDICVQALAGEYDTDRMSDASFALMTGMSRLLAVVLAQIPDEADRAERAAEAVDMFRSHLGAQIAAAHEFVMMSDVSLRGLWIN